MSDESTLDARARGVGYKSASFDSSQNSPTYPTQRVSTDDSSNISVLMQFSFCTVISAFTDLLPMMVLYIHLRASFVVWI